MFKVSERLVINATSCINVLQGYSEGEFRKNEHVTHFIISRTDGIFALSLSIYLRECEEMLENAPASDRRQRQEMKRKKRRKRSPPGFPCARLKDTSLTRRY